MTQKHVMSTCLAGRIIFILSQSQNTCIWAPLLIGPMIWVGRTTINLLLTAAWILLIQSAGRYFNSKPKYLLVLNQDTLCSDKLTESKDKGPSVQTRAEGNNNKLSNERNDTVGSDYTSPAPAFDSEE